jgi:hypothetical protein
MTTAQLRGVKNMATRIYTKASPPNAFIGGPVPVSSGFPIEASGMTDARRSEEEGESVSNDALVERIL